MKRKYEKLQETTVLERTHDQRHLNFEENNEEKKKERQDDFTPTIISRRIVGT